MKIFSCYTPAHEILYSQYFRPTLPADFELNVTAFSGEGSGDFLTPGFLICIRQKVDLIIKSLEDNDGQVLLWSDVDIMFFNTSAADLEKVFVESGNDILFQAEGRQTDELNLGFFVCRASEHLIDLFKNVRERLIADPKENEQTLVNELLPKRTDIKFGRLPFEYHARTHGWPPQDNLRTYHANSTGGKNGVQRKIQQFQQLAAIRRYGLPAKLWYSLDKIPLKIRNLYRRHLLKR